MVDNRDADNRSDAEKGPVVRTIDNIRVVGLTDDDATFYDNFGPDNRKKLVRKVDVRLVPMLSVLYLISQLDRANIGNAKIEGMDKDLGLSGVQYNIALSLFFVPYILFEIPSNMLLKKFARPSVYLGTLVTSWGIIMMCHGFVKNFAGLMVVRMMLGVLEAGFYPGAVYLCTFWYMPKELATRISVFYCFSALSGAFSGLLAAGIAEMNGIGGFKGWQWIFILEGILTIIMGILCFPLLIDSPRLSHRWLNSNEIRYLELQLFIKQGGRFSAEEENTSHHWQDFKAVITNPRMWGQAYILLCISACSYGNKFTLPSITKAMGFTNTKAQLMTVPPYIAGAISSIFFARLSDHFYWRMPFVAMPLTLIAVGYSIIISFKGNLPGHIGASMLAVIIACMGIYPVQPACSSWAANNIAPSSRRAVGVAFVIATGNIGGIIGSYMFFDYEAPSYYTGYGLAIAFGITGVLMSFVLEFSYVWSNKKRAKLSEHDIRSTYSEDDLLRMGDRSPLFKYTT
ncbi:major facilitator superfamily domain-containing protein [Truncatella angustata]|uniref:Major facilitator superfamily domain-containing protein n=1 Tax=Truncatella angustata TaxID=152316 RepID=A0A9P8US45_9PEZI|nr:major facilitator superfamily domain-containing protein [Truncatella angustata]KAH6658015.1 major facilitator superfamily domain-containing protein [Truncatella angustata]